MLRNFALVLFALGALSLPCAGAATEFHVSPSGSPAGNGSAGAPWDLATALWNHPVIVGPGDTIWLHHGVYRGNFESSLTGTAAAPIVVRQAPGERAVVDGGCSGRPILLVGGAYTWYWGFEVINSDPHRVTRDRGSFPPIRRGIGVYTKEEPGNGVGTRFINLVIHDTAEGIGIWEEAEGSEVYGNLIYYNGWEAPDRGHGHGIYAQNQNGTMRLVDNVIFDQFSHGIHAYGSSTAYLNGFHVEGNFIFNNGRMSLGGSARNILVGGGRVAENPVVIDNVAYYPFGSGGENNFGYSAGASNLVATGNWLVGDLTLWMITNPSYVLTGNTLIGNVYRFAPSDYPDNVYLPPVSPGGTKVFVRPNQYEPDRATVAIFNWDLSSSVDVDLSSVLEVGDAYEIRDVENFFGPPLAGGTYAGGTVAFPMGSTAIARPIGSVPLVPDHVGPEFGAFVVLPPVAPVSLCGNGVIDAGEACDDGGIVDGDGCSSACANESLCATGPVSGCRRVVRPNRSSLVLTHQSGVRDTLVWRWKQGAATSLADFGDPTAGTRYELCLYDAASSLVQRILVGAEESCGDPTWKATPTSWKYQDDMQLPDGKLKIALKAGALDGQSNIAVTGRGSFLATPTLPATNLPYRIQLRRSGSGTCWEATFPTATQNNATRLRATGS